MQSGIGKANKAVGGQESGVRRNLACVFRFASPGLQAGDRGWIACLGALAPGDSTQGLKPPKRGSRLPSPGLKAWASKPEHTRAVTVVPWFSAFAHRL